MDGIIRLTVCLTETCASYDDGSGLRLNSLGKLDSLSQGSGLDIGLLYLKDHVRQLISLNLLNELFRGLLGPVPIPFVNLNLLQSKFL